MLKYGRRAVTHRSCDVTTCY